MVSDRSRQDSTELSNLGIKITKPCRGHKIRNGTQKTCCLNTAPQWLPHQCFASSSCDFPALSTLSIPSLYQLYNRWRLKSFGSSFLSTASFFTLSFFSFIQSTLDDLDIHCGEKIWIVEYLNFAIMASPCDHSNNSTIIDYICIVISITMVNRK